MKRCLVIINSMGIGGAETFFMKLHRKLNVDKFQLDYCIVETFEEDYTAEIEELGGRIFLIPPKIKHPIRYYKEILRIVKKYNYTTVLRVSEHSLAVIDLLVAYFGGAHKLVFRTSNSQSDVFFVGAVHYMFRWLFKIVPIIKIAPSMRAAKYTFGKKISKDKKFTIINNGIDTERYRFDAVTRKKIRTKLGIAEDALVIGHVGRFMSQKNHASIIKILSQLKQKNNKFIALFLGEGPLMDNIETMAKELSVYDDCIFVGTRKNVNDYLMAMDVFLFPSLYEGMPNALIEAEAAGLPCVISNTITKEADITGEVVQLSLDADIFQWTSVISKIKSKFNREKYADVLKDNGYEVADIIKKFTEIIFERDSMHDKHN